jgi:hypothetical protein
VRVKGFRCLSHDFSFPLPLPERAEKRAYILTDRCPDVLRIRHVRIVLLIYGPGKEPPMAVRDIQTPERGNINFFYRPETGERAPEGRKTPASGPVGEGVYRILKHKDHTHPVYSLELPEKPGEAQDIFRVSDEAGCIVIKNPRKGSRAAKAGLSQGQQADFPEDLQSAINGEDFRGAESPDFLDCQGSEVILVSASEDILDEFGIELHPERESADTADIFTDLKLQKGRISIKPLFKGTMA